jgi:hypothetical protein
MSCLFTNRVVKRAYSRASTPLAGTSHLRSNVKSMERASVFVQGILEGAEKGQNASQPAFETSWMGKKSVHDTPPHSAKRLVT